MVNQNEISNLETGRTPYAVPPAQFTVKSVSHVSLRLVSHRLLVFQPISNRALEVLKKGGCEEPSSSFSMRQFMGGETRKRLSPRKLHPVLRAERAKKDRFATGQKNYFFGCFMNVILDVVK